ncbi:hypothetical protein NECAME_03936 [Necator americanus]|uniref:Uncharacterized protein n=1 Tax=Necator americanus TaxID=51031 RepID=W2SZ06_NECAM|nr:hypothetical protein NECAME_03936 [Necator americanus]ETN74803.1 hypothetical protein NECAME_03936 [Necator americanus]
MTAGIALWDQNTDIETEPQHSSPLGLQPRRYVRSQRSREEKTVGQLFEDSDYAGDFEQLDFTTIAEPSFVTKMPLRTTTAHVLKQSKKQGNFKHVKRVRHFYGRRLRTNSTTPSNASPTSFLYEIGPKPAMRDVEVNSLTSPPPSSPPIFHNSPARKLNATFATRGTAGSSSSAALVVDNSVTRTDLIGIQQPGLPNLTDFESGHENTVADEDAASVETSPTSTAMTTTLAQTSSTALPTTTFSNSPMTAETMSTTEYSTITSEYSESETVELLSTIPNEVPEDIEESSNTSTTTEEVELLDAETKELHYPASAESNPTPKSLPSDIPSLQTEGFSSTTTMMETSTTLMPTTTSSTTSSTTTAATSVATSTATSVATSTPTIVATTKPTTTTNALTTTTTTTITKDALEAAATIVPETFAKDEVVDKIKDAVPELMATKWGNRASEQEQLLSSSTSRSAQVDSTTSLRQEKKRLVNYVGFKLFRI